MTHAIFIGGFKHGVLEAVQEPEHEIFVYEFPKKPAIIYAQTYWDPVSPALNFYQVVYKHKGIWNSQYGYIHVYIESTSAFVNAILPAYIAEPLVQHTPNVIYVLDVNPHKDEVACLIEHETAKQLMYKMGSLGKNVEMFPTHGLIIPDGVMLPKNLWVASVDHAGKNITLETLNKLLKQTYMDPLQVQLSEEMPPKWFYESFEQARKHPHFAWLNGGLREAKRDKLCYECAREIVGPQFADFNDLKVPKSQGKRVRKLVCGNCGRGKFNRRGQRIGDWPKGEFSG